MIKLKRNSMLSALMILAIILIAGTIGNLYAQSPNMSVDPEALSFGEVEIGEQAVLSYTLTGSNLISSVLLHASGIFMISLEENDGFQQNLTIHPVDGEVSATVYVRFAPIYPREYNGRVRNRTMGVSDQMVTLNGTGVLDLVDMPELAITPDSLYFGELMIGEYLVQSYSLTGTNLITDVFVHASRGYFVSLYDDEGFQRGLVIEPVDGEVTETIYVKFQPLMPGEYCGRIRNNSFGAVNQNVNVYGTAVLDDQFLPELTALPDSLYFGEVEIGEAMILNYNLSGDNLISNVLIRAPRGYLISLDDDGDFQHMLVIEPVDGSIDLTVYVKFQPVMPRHYFGAVRNRTLGIMGRPVRVRGVGIPADPDIDGDIADSQITEVLGNYPNPFNPETTIALNVSEPGFVELKIYNSRGQMVKTLVNEFMQAGEHRFRWNGRDEANREVSSGIYFYRMKQGTVTSNGKMILMK